MCRFVGGFYSHNQVLKITMWHDDTHIIAIPNDTNISTNATEKITNYTDLKDEKAIFWEYAKGMLR